MKLSRIIVAALAGAALLASCQREVDLGPSRLQINPGELTFEEAGAPQNITVLGTRDWIVSSDIPDWVALSVNEGKASIDNVNISVSVTENLGYDRSASIVFTTGFNRGTLNVYQAGPLGVFDNGDGSKEKPFTVAGVIEYVQGLGADVNSTVSVYVKGKISKVSEEFNTNYGNGTFIISDDGTDADKSNQFTAYRVLYLGNKKFTASDTQIKVGDDVILYGKVVNFKGNTPETVQGDAFLFSLNGVDKGGDGGDAGEVQGTGTEADPFNVAAAIAKAKETGETATSEVYYIKGTVKTVSLSAQFKNADLDLVDSEDGAVFKAYRIKSFGGADITGNEPIKAGDVVVVCGNIVNYRGNTPETTQGGKLVKWNDKTSFDGGGDDPQPSDIKAVTVAEFIAAEESSTQKYELVGVISGNVNTTYGNFDLVDDSGSVYVYGLTATDLGYGKSNDKSFASLGLAAGDKIKIVGYRGSYNGKVEVLYAYFVEKVTEGGDDPDPSGIKAVTVAEFLAAPESDTQKYELVGVISGNVNTTYGNFDLVDDSGSVYVYGLTATDLGYGKSNDKSFASLGLAAGDKIKIVGYRGSYNGKVEVLYAYFVEKVTEGGDDPDPSGIKAVTVAEFLAAPESDTQKYELVGVISGNVNTTYGNFDLVDDSGSVYVYGLTATDLGYGKSNDKSFASLGLAAGDKIKIVGYRGSYNGKVEVLYAYFVEKVTEGGDDPDPSGIKAVTVSEFLAAPESDTQKYELVGVISGNVNTTYGNFDLVDDSGSVYVYGLTATDLGYGKSNDKSFASLGLAAGDKIKIVGYRGSYNGKDEVLYAYFVEKLGGGEDPTGGDDPGEVGDDIVLSFVADSQEKISSYSKTWEATKGNYTWTIANFNNNNNQWNYIKCGSKNDVSVASIANKTVFGSAITGVVVTYDAFNASNVNSTKLIVASDASFTNVVETVTGSVSDKGDYTYAITKPAANQYYKLEIDCKKGTANGFVQISKVTYKVSQ